MDVFLEYRAWLILPAMLFLVWVAKRGKRESQPPAPVAPVQPQQPEPVESNPNRGLDKFIWVLLIVAVVFLGFMFLTDPSGGQIPDIASIQRVLNAGSMGALFANWNVLTGNPDGSEPIGSGTALVMLVIVLFAFAFGRGSKKRGGA